MPKPRTFQGDVLIAFETIKEAVEAGIELDDAYALGRTLMEIRDLPTRSRWTRRPRATRKTK